MEKIWAAVRYRLPTYGGGPHGGYRRAPFLSIGLSDFSAKHFGIFPSPMDNSVGIAEGRSLGSPATILTTAAMVYQSRTALEIPLCVACSFPFCRSS